MHKLESTEDKSRMTSDLFVGDPAFTKEQAYRADTMETWGTDFSDPGPDFCEFRLLKDGEVIATKRVDGY